MEIEVSKDGIRITKKLWDGGRLLYIPRLIRLAWGYPDKVEIIFDDEKKELIIRPGGS